MERDQILDKWDENENSEPNSYSSEAVGSASFSFEPVSENHGKGSDAETSDTHSNKDTEEKIELEEGFNLCAEKKSQGRQNNSWQNDHTRSDPINQGPDDRGHDHINRHSYGLGPRRLGPAPMEMVNESHKEDGKSSPDTEPECHGDHGEAYDHPSVVESP